MTICNCHRRKEYTSLNMWLSVWITAFLAFLIASGNCIPVTEETGSNSYDDGDLVSNKETSTTEGDGFTLESTVGEENATDETETEELEIEGSGKCPTCSGEADEIQPSSERIIVKKSYAEDRGSDNDDDDDDDDDDEDDDDDDDDRKKRETSKSALRSFKLLDGRTKRSNGPQDENTRGFVESSNNEETISEDSRATKEVEDVRENVSDRTRDMYDYTKNGMDSSRAESTVLRKRRQSGETVPYVKPNLSRRDIPVYPLYYVPTMENTSDRGEEKERENVPENDYNDEDED